ncbi:MAG: hypothetical protein U0V03_04350 [Bacteroidia bacterium]
MFLILFSVCLSKGLGAPVGSLLIGDKEFIYKAKRIRKFFMEVCYVFLAEAGLFAFKK